jgi:hypothetical protein
MRSHVVTCGKLDPGERLDGLKKSRMKPVTLGAVDWYGKGRFDLFEFNAGTADTIAAYYCPYEDNQALYVYLGDDADYMFTPSVSGCTFGIGSRTDKGGVLVGHANAKQVGTEADDAGAADGGRAAQAQAQAQADMLSKPKMGDAPRLIVPEDYVLGDRLKHVGTIMGVRRGDFTGPSTSGSAWVFYTQTFTRTGQLVRLRAEFVRAV